MVTKFGLDLGYANITLSDSSSVVYREPSIALIDKESRRIVAVGDHATLLSSCPEYKSMVDLQKLDEEHKSSEKEEVATNV